MPKLLVNATLDLHFFPLKEVLLLIRNLSFKGEILVEKAGGGITSIWHSESRTNSLWISIY